MSHILIIIFSPFNKVWYPTYHSNTPMPCLSFSYFHGNWHYWLSCIHIISLSVVALRVQSSSRWWLTRPALFSSLPQLPPSCVHFLWLIHLPPLHVGILPHHVEEVNEVSTGILLPQTSTSSMTWISIRRINTFLYPLNRKNIWNIWKYDFY